MDMLFHKILSYLCPYLGLAHLLTPAPLLLHDATAGEYEVEGILDLYIGHSGTSIEHWVYTTILSWQLNMKCNTGDNVTNRERSNPILGKLAR